MCTVVHLEPEDFARELVHNPKNVYARTYVLDCGLAVVIYMCLDSHFLYYLDRPDRKSTRLNSSHITISYDVL